LVKGLDGGKAAGACHKVPILVYADGVQEPIGEDIVGEFLDMSFGSFSALTGANVDSVAREELDLHEVLLHVLEASELTLDLSHHMPASTDTEVESFSDRGTRRRWLVWSIKLFTCFIL